MSTEHDIKVAELNAEITFCLKSSAQFVSLANVNLTVATKFADLAVKASEDMAVLVAEAVQA